jgi:hypothetical protein
VAFAAVELPHLLQQVGLNLHQFDAVRSSWLLHCISPQSKINLSMIIPDLASKLFIVCGARIAHSRTVPSLHYFVIFTAMKLQIIHQTSPKAHRNNIDWCCDDGVDSCCCCCVKPNTSNWWPNTNISQSISWWQLRRKGANDKTIMAAIHISIETMAKAVRQG